jgi:uncharacterized protein YqkB
MKRVVYKRAININLGPVLFNSNYSSKFTKDRLTKQIYKSIQYLDMRKNVYILRSLRIGTDC